MIKTIEEIQREIEELIACSYVDRKDVDVEAIVRNVAEGLKVAYILKPYKIKQYIEGQR